MNHKISVSFKNYDDGTLQPESTGFWTLSMNSYLKNNSMYSGFLHQPNWFSELPVRLYERLVSGFVTNTQ